MQQISSQISRVIWLIRVAKTMRDNEKNKILTHNEYNRKNEYL